jgi:hypothetical protein
MKQMSYRNRFQCLIYFIFASWLIRLMLQISKQALNFKY